MDRRLFQPRRRRSHSGQGTAEYIIVVVLVAIAAITVSSLYGATLRPQVAGVALELSGERSEPAVSHAGSMADAAVADALRDRSMGDYSNHHPRN